MLYGFLEKPIRLTRREKLFYGAMGILIVLGLCACLGIIVVLRMGG